MKFSYDISSSNLCILAAFIFILLIINNNRIGSQNRKDKDHYFS